MSFISDFSEVPFLERIVKLLQLFLCGWLCTTGVMTEICVTINLL